MAYHHRTATLALALALAAGIPAAASAQQPGQPGSPATPSPCSEVCSGGGYTSGTSTTTCPYSLPVILNDLGNPGPCSEVCSGCGYGPVNPPSRTPDHSSAYPPHVRIVTQGAGFHWGDAGIGAGGMLALIVTGLGGALTLTRRRSHRIHDDRTWTMPNPPSSPAADDGDLDVIDMADHRQTRNTRSQ
jgi:hypothetical protein